MGEVIQVEDHEGLRDAARRERFYSAIRKLAQEKGLSEEMTLLFRKLSYVLGDPTEFHTTRSVPEAALLDLAIAMIQEQKKLIQQLQTQQGVKGDG